MNFRPLALALFLVAACTPVPGCATVPPGTPPTPGTNLEACSDAAVNTGAQAILGEVTSALATGNYVAALADLASRFGGPEVVCAVTYVVQELQSKLAASPPGAVDPVLAAELARAQAYLKSPDAAKAAKKPTASLSPLDACDAACGKPGSSLAPPSGCQCWVASKTNWRASRWVALAR